MVKKLTLQNFQTHKKTAVEFKPGVNAITGISDSGKTSLLRALYWILQNRPAAGIVLSHWAKSKDGKQTEPITAEILLDNGITVKRNKDIDENSYTIIDTEDKELKFEAIGKDVPEDVQLLLNMGEVNIQKQLDAPFLLSESAGEIARFFNEIIHLEDIDKALSAADSIKRQNTAELKSAELLKTQIEAKANAFFWLDLATPQLEKCINMGERLELIKTDCDNIGILKQQFVATIDKLNKYNGLQSLIAIFEECEKIGAEVASKTDELIYMRDFCNQFKTVQQNIAKIPDVKSIQELLTDTEALSVELKKGQQDIDSIDELIENITNGTKTVLTLSKKIMELIATLPDTCVSCGAPLKDGVYVA
jgi:DNA repair protein SbcC/Rad50